jgi:hypothetical protein
MNEKWWCATLIVCSSVKDDETDLYLCDEQIHLVRAANSEAAVLKAIQIGREQEHSYESIDGHHVTWKFIGLQGLEEVLDEDIVDGTEIRSKFIKVENPDDLVIQEP